LVTINYGTYLQIVNQHAFDLVSEEGSGLHAYKRLFEAVFLQQTLMKDARQGLYSLVKDLIFRLCTFGNISSTPWRRSKPFLINFHSSRGDSLFTFERETFFDQAGILKPSPSFIIAQHILAFLAAIATKAFPYPRLALSSLAH